MGFHICITEAVAQSIAFTFNITFYHGQSVMCSSQICSWSVARTASWTAFTLKSTLLLRNPPHFSMTDSKTMFSKHAFITRFYKVLSSHVILPFFQGQCKQRKGQNVLSHRSINGLTQLKWHLLSSLLGGASPAPKIESLAKIGSRDLSLFGHCPSRLQAPYMVSDPAGDLSAGSFLGWLLHWWAGI